jgi:DNA-binding LacI/PurR family transcriptional regulator
MEKKVNNIKELAGKLGLSPTTVSRVLNGKSKKFRISKETSQKVLDAALKYNYSPNRIARGLKLEKTDTIGLIIPDIANPYFGSIAKTIEVEARNSGYSIILCDSLDDEITEAELLQLLAGRKVDGIIIAPTGKSSRHVTEILQQGIPVNESMILGTDFGEENGYIQTKKLLDLPNRPTAIFALSNLISLGTLRALKEAGLTVPEDISIVSFDEQPYSAFLACPMTTVEQPREEIGRLAFNFLLKTIGDGMPDEPVKLMLQPRLIYRESVKKISNCNQI